MLKELQEAIVLHLKADAYMNGTSIIPATKGNLGSAIETELGKVGLCVVVEPLRGTLKHAGSKISSEPTFQLHIFENVMVNRNQVAFKTAEDVLERICWLLRGGQGCPPPVFATSWELVNDLTEELTYRIEATARGALELYP